MYLYVALGYFFPIPRSNSFSFEAANGHSDYLAQDCRFSIVALGVLHGRFCADALESPYVLAPRRSALADLRIISVAICRRSRRSSRTDTLVPSYAGLWEPASRA